jgi:Cu(I)/Ag(I) efflux system membrane fusion protein
MKNVIVILVVILLTLALTACTQKEVKPADQNTQLTTEPMNTAEMKVYGSCGMCKDRIKTTAKGVEGVKSAVWNQETEMLKVETVENFDMMKIHTAVSAVGHDTDLMKADDKVYAALPGCCKYRDM